MRNGQEQLRELIADVLAAAQGTSMAELDLVSTIGDAEDAATYRNIAEVLIGSDRLVISAAPDATTGPPAPAPGQQWQVKGSGRLRRIIDFGGDIDVIWEAHDGKKPSRGRAKASTWSKSHTYITDRS